MLTQFMPGTLFQDPMYLLCSYAGNFHHAVGPFDSRWDPMSRKLPVYL